MAQASGPLFDHELWQVIDMSWKFVVVLFLGFIWRDWFSILI